MKVKLSCTYYSDTREKLGEPGDVIELPPKAAQLLLNGGSAELVEPPKKSERD